MKDRIQILEILSKFDVTESESSWELYLQTSDDLYFKIDIPKSINEWFVSLYKNDSREEIWSDWSDWFLSGEINKKNVEYCFQKDIEYFIERILSATDFRIVEKPIFKIFGKEFLKIKNLEALINKRWIQIEPGELPYDYEIPA